MLVGPPPFEMVDAPDHPFVRVLVGCMSSGGPGGGCRSPGRRLSVGRASRLLQPDNQHVQAGGEAVVVVVEPNVLAEGDQGGEAVGGQGAEELVQLGAGGCVADALLVGGDAGAADRKADGVVGDEEEGQPGLALGEAGGVQWCQERLCQGQGVRPEGVAGLEDPGDPRVGLQDRA
jgi:hypothetical protein